MLWGIDLGGTKIEGALLDTAHPGTAVHRLRVPTEGGRGYEHVLEQINRLIENLERQSGQSRPARIGIGTPGTIEPTTGQLKNSNTRCLNGRTLRDDLSRALGVQALLANDANCFALAETKWGAGRGAGVVFGLILGTGVGGGLVVDGKLVSGLHGIAGEWGHNPIPGESTPCYCGRLGCVETVLAGPSLERFYHEISGVSRKLPEIAARAAEDAHARATLNRLRDKFGVALAAVLNIVDPDAVVIGGGVGNLPLLYEEATRHAVQAHVFNPELRTRILPPLLGDSAGVFGAALLAA